MSRELNVTFRGGRVMAAYLYLGRESKAPVARTKRAADGMLIDYNTAGEPLGVEFTAPSKITLAGVNDLLRSLGQEPATPDELWPLVRHGADVAA